MSDAPNVEKSSPTFTVRPTKELLPKLQQLAEEVGRSEAQLMQESVSAIIEMVETGYDFVPPLVQRARLWREHLSRKVGRLLGGAAVTAEDQGRIMPSESVRNLSPELMFIPVYPDYCDFTPDEDDFDRVDFMSSTPCEKVGIPFIKANGATFGVRLDLSSDTSILGIPKGMRTGDILLLATPQRIQRDRHRKNPDANPNLNDKEYATRHRPNVLGVYDRKAIFVGRVNATLKNQKTEDGVVYVPAGVANEKSMSIPLSKCSSLAVIVQQLLIPGSTYLDF